MNKVIIATDSSAYLPKEYVDQYQIPVLPLTVNWEGKSYYDGIDIQAEEFYQQLSQSKSMATTSQITVGQFLEVFGKLLDAGNQVLYLGISSGISATIDSALQASAELGNPDNLIVMDSKLVSMALGLMVVEAARAAEKGGRSAEKKLQGERHDRQGRRGRVHHPPAPHEAGRCGKINRKDQSGVLQTQGQSNQGQYSRRQFCEDRTRAVRTGHSP